MFSLSRFKNTCQRTRNNKRKGNGCVGSEWGNSYAIGFGMSVTDSYSESKETQSRAGWEARWLGG
jgi:hypothetical protein